MLRSTVLVLAMVVALAMPGLALAGAQRATVLAEPVDWIVEGCAESIHLSGTLQRVYHSTSNDTSYHIVGQTNWRGVTGVGLETGTQYQATATEVFTMSGRRGEVVTRPTSFKLIGRGTVDNYLLQATWHYTVNANGEATAGVYNESIRCQG